MQLPIPVQRRGFQFAYAGLRVYWFVFRPHSNGVKCVFTDGDRVLLVRHSYGPRRWELPGGGIRRHEPPLRTARREMLEELGRDVPEWSELGMLIVRLHHHQVTLHCFRAELSDPRVEPARGELDAAAWFDRRDLPPKLGKYVRTVLDLLPG